jgi:thermitase
MLRSLASALATGLLLLFSPGGGLASPAGTRIVVGYTYDEYLPTQWSVTKTHAEQAWDVSTGSSQMVVGILDTGVDPSQPDLRGKLVAGYDYVNNDQDPSDDNGHGTAVAGVVAASSDNGIGVAGYCWACRLMPVKVLGADGTGFASGLAQGIVWATDHGARVINASLGSPVTTI